MKNPKTYLSFAIQLKVSPERSQEPLMYDFPVVPEILDILKRPSSTSVYP